MQNVPAYNDDSSVTNGMHAASYNETTVLLGELRAIVSEWNRIGLLDQAVNLLADTKGLPVQAGMLMNDTQRTLHVFHEVGVRAMTILDYALWCIIASMVGVPFLVLLCWFRCRPGKRNEEPKPTP